MVTLQNEMLNDFNTFHTTSGYRAIKAKRVKNCV